MSRRRRMKGPAEQEETWLRTIVLDASVDDHAVGCAADPYRFLDVLRFLARPILCRELAHLRYLVVGEVESEDLDHGLVVPRLVCETDVTEVQDAHVEHLGGIWILLRGEP